MHCEQSERWISLGADQELSVQEVGLLREHLAQCAPCQALADASHDLRRWFVSPPQEPIPAGFAERVVALAFDSQAATAAGPRGLVEQGSVEPLEAGGARMHGFLLQMTALAALLLVALAFALAGKQASESNDLHADPTSIESVIEGLDQLNAEEPVIEAVPEDESNADEGAGELEKAGGDRD